jgi:hypothetical protein
MVNSLGIMRLREARVDRTIYYSDNNYTCIEYLPSTIYLPIYLPIRQEGGNRNHLPLAYLLLTRSKFLIVSHGRLLEGLLD